MIGFWNFVIILCCPCGVLLMTSDTMQKWTCFNFRMNHSNEAILNKLSMLLDNSDTLVFGIYCVSPDHIIDGYLMYDTYYHSSEVKFKYPMILMVEGTPSCNSYENIMAVSLKERVPHYRVFRTGYSVYVPTLNRSQIL